MISLICIVISLFYFMNKYIGLNLGYNDAKQLVGNRYNLTEVGQGECSQN